MIADRLIARLPKKRVAPVGISASDLKGIPLTPDLKTDILEAIRSGSTTDASLGIFFAENLAQPGVDLQFERDLLEASLEIFKSGKRENKEGCLSLLVLLGRNMSNYRELMLAALRDSDPIVRKKALTAYRSFARPNEFQPLEAFESDDYLTEVGMGSYLVYDLRNQALEMIEKVIGRTFPKSEKTAVIDNGVMTFWWDWQPFHKWKRSWWRKLGLLPRVTILT